MHQKSFVGHQKLEDSSYSETSIDPMLSQSLSSQSQSQTDSEGDAFSWPDEDEMDFQTLSDSHILFGHREVLANTVYDKFRCCASGAEHSSSEAPSKQYKLEKLYSGHY